jgi:hypothetical protein
MVEDLHLAWQWNDVRTGEAEADQHRKSGHRQGRKVRFWGAPDKPCLWRELLQDGVDLINTDDLDGAQKLLLENPESNCQMMPARICGNLGL